MIAIYVRQSVDKRDSISIESQIDLCKKEFGESENYKVYQDKGFSGKDTNRPSFEEMINNIKAGNISKVIVYKLDRISRSTLDFANIINVFKKHNVEFISTTEKFDTSTPIGQAMLQIVMVFAELERNTIQQRIKDNYYARGKKGFYMGGRAPYGFTKVKTEVEGKKTYTFKEDVEQLPHLVEMYELYANTDMSLGRISNYLNKKSVPAAQGGKWDSCKISRILRNPVYVKADADIYQYYKSKGCIITNEANDFLGINGCYLYGKRDVNERKYTNVENHNLSLALHEGVIDSHTFLLCQYKLDSNKQIKNSGQGRHSWLSGYAKCGYCGYAVSIIYSNSVGGYRYFNCRGKTNLQICEGHSKALYADQIESIVERYLIEKVAELKGAKLEVENKGNLSVNKLKLHVLEIDKQIENLINQIAESNAIVTKYINDKITNLDDTKNTLLEEIKKITIEDSKSLPMEEIIEKVEEWVGLSLEEKKRICGCFINKVFITDDEIKIDWKV